MTLDNGVIENLDSKAGIPSGVDLKIPVDVGLVADFVRDFLRAGYDISVEQIYSDSFAAGKLDHYLLTVNGNINVETIDATIVEE